MDNILKSKAEKLAKNAENLPFIFGSVNLTAIRENVGEILKLIGRDGIFREYTLHDANHIDAMLALVDKIIPTDTADQMKIADWLMIVLSCYFHDLGMVVTKNEFQNRSINSDFLRFKDDLLAGDKGRDYEDALRKLNELELDEFFYQEYVRKNHAKRIYNWIKGQETTQFGEAKDMVLVINELLNGLEKIFRDDLAKICQSHHEDDLFDFDKYQIIRVYGDEPEGEANLHYCALILRTVDILQIQKKRVPSVLYKLIDPSNPKSQEEWAKQNGVRAIKPRIGSDIVEVHASFDKESAYFGLLAYLQQYAGKELDRCYSWAKLANKKGSTFQYPWKQIDTTQVEPRGFEGRSYRFTLDQDRILKLLTGHTLYNDSRVAVREVLQNALDAVRFRKYQFSNEELGKIEIEWNVEERKLIIRDTGTGMTEETIEKFLLNVGSSFYQSETVLQKYSGFSAISRFGIGVLSTFMIADEVQILTVHPDDQYARKLTLPSVVKSYLIKNIPKGDPSLEKIGTHGTEVTLQVRRSADLNDVEELVRYWLVIPECEVTYRENNEEPVVIGFKNAKEVVNYYFELERENERTNDLFNVRSECTEGIEIAYVLKRSYFDNKWNFAHMVEEDDDGDASSRSSLLLPPGICIEGLRVRSTPAGYDSRYDTPWVFANLTGSNAPKTNVARSDIEQTPEATRMYKLIYSLLGKYVQFEFDRLLREEIGIIEAANEVVKLLEDINKPSILDRKLFEEMIAELKIVAMEDESEVKCVSCKQLIAYKSVWTVASTLFDDIAGVSGALGINMSTENIVKALGKEIRPAIPVPRLLTVDDIYLKGLEVDSFNIYIEGRSKRIDFCWKMLSESNWVSIPESILRKIADYRHYDIRIAKSQRLLQECSKYDLILSRGIVYIISYSILDLLNAIGMTETFVQYVKTLIRLGKLPNEELPLLKEQLRKVNKEDILDRLSLPLDRRSGETFF